MFPVYHILSPVLLPFITIFAIKLKIMNNNKNMKKKTEVVTFKLQFLLDFYNVRWMIDALFQFSIILTAFL